MARQPRIEYCGAFYHVIVRGNQQQDIFLDDEDRYEYLGRLQRYKEKHGFVLYAYTLMSNHLHLLIETPETPISKIMQVLNFTYTQYFNRKYGKVGHLFQGRYKALLCDRDEYLLALVRYIHLNPVRAGMVADPLDYKWSSHAAYLGKVNDKIDCAQVLRLFSERISEAKSLYARFVMEEIGKGSDLSFYSALDQQILGDEKFADRAERQAERTREIRLRASLDEIFGAIQSSTGISKDEITSRSRRPKVAEARIALVVLWRMAGNSLASLQIVLKRDLSVISRIASLENDTRAKQIIEKTLGLLNAYLQA